AYYGEKEGIMYASLLSLQTFYGISVILGTIAFGFIVVKNSVECMIARQYLCQASSLMVSASLLAFTTLGDYSGFLLFVCIHGFFYGGYQYSLKMFVYEKVRARNFNRAWSFVQCAQSIPILVGIPITAFLNEHYGDRSGFYLSSVTAALGSFVLFFIDAHKKNSSRKRRLSSPETSTVGVRDVNSHLSRYSSRDSRSFFNPSVTNTKVLRRASADSISDTAFRLNRLPIGTAVVPIRGNAFAFGRSNSLFGSTFGAPINELTCISEEVIMDNFLDEFVIDDCLTSCDREAKYLMLSEFENNLGNSVVPQEAAALVKSRKEKLKDVSKLKPEHDVNCPFKNGTAMVTSPTVPYLEPKRPLIAQNRRASFAGFASFVNDNVSPFSQPCTSKQHSNVNNFSTFLPTHESLDQCPNCLKLVDCKTQEIGAEIVPNINFVETHNTNEVFDEIDENIDEDSIDGELQTTIQCSPKAENSQFINQ
ncbi:monocarboxylate transporter 10-like protein, partial [Leptotrombidium deliense]